MYTNPGSGLFFLQIMIAACLTFGYRFRHAVSALFGKKQDRSGT
jgi:hypothetical protein